VVHRSRREQRNCATNRSEVSYSFTTPWSESLTYNETFRSDPSLLLCCHELADMPITVLSCQHVTGKFKNSMQCQELNDLKYNGGLKCHVHDTLLGVRLPLWEPSHR
jgi:hypothetical protein